MILASNVFWLYYISYEELFQGCRTPIKRAIHERCLSRHAFSFTRSRLGFVCFYDTVGFNFTHIYIYIYIQLNFFKFKLEKIIIYNFF
jgi:hypothetical protein